jgi:hypothetical protein
MSDLDFTIIHWRHAEREPQLAYITDVKKWGEIIAGHAQKGAALGVNCGKMCGDCAFNFNQPHDVGYAEAVDGAVGMLSFAGKFHCHTDDHQDGGKPCAGVLYAEAYLKNLNDDGQ